MLAIIPVNSLLDNGDDAKTTLREAIEQANLNPNHDTITFDPILDVGLGPGEKPVIILTQSASFDTRLIISQDVTIDASMLTSGITIDANDTDGIKNGNGKRLFDITAGDVEFINLTLTGADVPRSGFVPGGGAIRSLGVLTIRDSLISGNAAEDGGGIYHGNGSPFGLTNTQTTLTIINSRIENNQARYGGGGGLMVVVGIGGGAPSTFNDTVMISGSTFSGNTASSYGGGISLRAASSLGTANFTIADSTISDNGAGSDGGGLRVDMPGFSHTWAPGAEFDH